MRTKMERAACVRKTWARSCQGAAYSPKDALQSCNKDLLRQDDSSLIADMPSKITLGLGTALAAIALCCFIESSFAQDAIDASLGATENDDSDAEDKDDRDEKSGRRRTRTTGHLSSGFLTQS